MSNLKEHAERELKIIGEENNVIKAQLPGTADELKGIFQKTSIKCLKLVEELKHINAEVTSINESLAKLDELLNEIEKKEQENGN